MKIGRHSDVAATGSDISAQVTIGNYCSISTHVQMHDRIDHACIAHPELVSTHQFRGYPACTSRSEIIIGSDVWIGRNAVLLGGITIGHGAIIGAFSVVAKDVPPYAIVAGNPARVLRYRFVPQNVAKLLAIAWWDWPDELVQARADDLRSIRSLITNYDPRP